MAATDCTAEDQTYTEDWDNDQTTQKHETTSYIICIVKNDGAWVKDFKSMGVECQMQIGVGTNQKADKITPVTLTEPAQWIECAFAPCWRYEATIGCMALSFAGLLLAGLPKVSFSPICTAQALISLLETHLACLRPPIVAISKS